MLPSCGGVLRSLLTWLGLKRIKPLYKSLRVEVVSNAVIIVCVFKCRREEEGGII